MSRRGGGALAMIALTAALAIPPGAAAQNQGKPAAEARIDSPTLLFDNRFRVKVEWDVTFGVTRPVQPLPSNDSGLFFFADPRNIELVLRVLEGPGCRFDRVWLLCAPLTDVEVFKIKLGPLDDKLKIKAEVPKLPKGGTVKAGAGDDAVQGGKNRERINAGKGNDRVNPGKGRDQVKLGAGNDKANTRDGERDVVNGGKGKKDSAKVDRFDKVKNVEKVNRK